MNELYVVGGMALVTFAIRYSTFALGSRIDLPTKVINALRYVPPTVLTAIVVPAVLIPDGSTISFSYTNAQLVGAFVAIAVSWFSRNLLLTILTSMGTFLIWQWLF